MKPLDENMLEYYNNNLEYYKLGDVVGYTC